MTSASSLMGPLLLKGWAMSAEACDECMVPLMADRKHKASICCECETELAKMVVSGGRIVQDGPLFLIEGGGCGGEFRVRKENGMFKLAGEIKEEAAPEPVEEVKTEAIQKPEPVASLP